MLKAEPKGAGAEGLYETVAQLHQEAMYDEYYERTSNWIAEFLHSEMMQMGREAQICAGEIKNWLWIEALDDISPQINSQDIPIVRLEENGREMKFYEDQNLVKYTCDGEDRYFFALPVYDGQTMIADVIVALCANG